MRRVEASMPTGEPAVPATIVDALGKPLAELWATPVRWEPSDQVLCRRCSIRVGD